MASVPFIDKMNPEVKQKWVAALRSKEYTQGHGQLKDDAGSLCCLGLLCEIHAKEKSRTWVYVIGEPSTYLAYENERFLPPQAVLNWAGLITRNPAVAVTDPEEGPELANSMHTLSHLNDEKRFTFEQIADLIEEQL